MIADHPILDSIGNSAALGMSIMMFVASIALRWYLGFLNNKKKREQFSERSAELRLKSIEELGDHHPGEFRLPFSWQQKVRRSLQIYDANSSCCSRLLLYALN